MNSARTPVTTPDLFSTPQSSASPSANPPSSSPGIAHAPVATSLPRHVLPSDLPNAVQQLEDSALDRLLSAVLAEQKRRGKKLPVSDKRSRKRQVETVAVPMTSGRLNAVRAAFKAGVTLSRIARQFGISTSDVRKALASDAAKR
jgi:hypothetical protein